MASTSGAGDGARTRNTQLGKLMRYQLRYARSAGFGSNHRQPLRGCQPLITAACLKRIEAIEYNGLCYGCQAGNDTH